MNYGKAVEITGLDDLISEELAKRWVPVTEENAVEIYDKYFPFTYGDMLWLSTKQNEVVCGYLSLEFDIGKRKDMPVWRYWGDNAVIYDVTAFMPVYMPEPYIPKEG